MSFQSFGIDERSLDRLSGMRDRWIFHEKMLQHALGNGDNVLAKISLSVGREEVVLLPAIQWLVSPPPMGIVSPRRILVIGGDGSRLGKLAELVERLGASLGAGSGGGGRFPVGLLRSLAESEAEGGATFRLEGKPEASVLVGDPAALVAASQAGAIALREFGFLVIEQAERLVEFSSDFLRLLSQALLPSWERRCIVACDRINAKVKNLAWEFADNPVEIHVEEAVAKAQSLESETWYIGAEQKLLFLLSLIERERPERLCIFCNLKSSAEELALRLGYNGVSSDFILGSLSSERKAAILAGVATGDRQVLVLTDEGALGLSPSAFTLLVNYDMPLEPEYYVKRLEMLDRAAEGARIVNLACDRYVYGLPAVESYIESSLAARPVEEASLVAEDKSAHLLFEGPRFPKGGARRGPIVGRLVPKENDRDGPERLVAPRHGEPRHHQSSDQRQRGRPQEDRGPDIKRSIAEATGGSFGVEDSQSRSHPSRATGKGSGAAQQRESRNSGTPKGRGDSGTPKEPGRGGRPGNAKNGARGRGHPSGHASSRHPAFRSVPQKREGGEAVVNPYDLPMEERLRRYREKYGKKNGEKGRERRRGGAPVERSNPVIPPEVEAASQRNSPPMDSHAVRSPSTKGELEDTKPGMFGKLIGFFRNKTPKN